jgi:putative FmdB family regulatory protein
MPTYEYQCTSCQHRFEAKQSIKDDALKTCPACQEHALARVVSGGLGFIFTDPQTLGGIADRNARDMARRGELPAQVRRNKDYAIPWWRKDKHKVDKRVLNNPEQYIETGYVSNG